MNTALTYAELLTDSATEDALDGLYLQSETEFDEEVLPLANSEHMFEPSHLHRR